MPLSLVHLWQPAIHQLWRCWWQWGLRQWTQLSSKCLLAAISMSETRRVSISTRPWIFLVENLYRARRRWMARESIALKVVVLLPVVVLGVCASRLELLSFAQSEGTTNPRSYRSWRLHNPAWTAWKQKKRKQKIEYCKNSGEGSNSKKKGWIMSLLVHKNAPLLEAKVEPAVVVKIAPLWNEFPGLKTTHCALRIPEVSWYMVKGVAVVNKIEKTWFGL